MSFHGIDNSPRVPVQPLIERYGSFSALARSLGLECTQTSRWRDRGVPVDLADRAAVYLGMHPIEVWPDWYSASADVAA